MGSVGCGAECRDAESGCRSPAWREGPSNLWSLGLVMVVEALGSDLIQNLREVTAHLRASVSPSINEDSSSVPSQMAEGDSSSSTLSAWDTVHTLQLCVNIITRKMLRQ